MSGITITHGSDKPIPNIIGRTFQLKQPYQGRTEATVVEMVGRNAFGVPIYGCHLCCYTNGKEWITVDFAANEFVWEQGEAYQLQHERGFQWLKDVLKGE